MDGIHIVAFAEEEDPGLYSSIQRFVLFQTAQGCGKKYFSSHFIKSLNLAFKC